MRNLIMGRRKKTQAEIFSYSMIAVFLASISGLTFGHVTEQAMHARLSDNPPQDPVERYQLGRNAYQTGNAQATPVPPAEYAPGYADASQETGKYRKGARILTPAEPARNIERLRLERLQAWNEDYFGPDADWDDEPVGHVETDTDDHPPIDVGAVIDAAEAVAPSEPIENDDSGI